MYAPVSGPLAAGSSKGNCPDPGLSGSAWFESLVRPDAPVVQYAAAPPRGMTNPPQNPKVRAALVKELNEYGVAFEPPAWPPAPVRCSPTAASASATAANTMASPARKAPFGPVVPPSMTAQMRRSLQRGKNISQSMPQLDVSSPSSHAAFPASPGKAGGKRGAIGCGPARNAMAAAGVVMQRQDDVRSSMGSTGDISHHHRDSVNYAGGHKDGVQAHHHSHSQSPFRQNLGLHRVVSEHELHDGISALRSQGRLHRACEEARFRSGVADSQSPEPWSNDASQLSAFHNQAMRAANPSRLEKLPEEKKKRRKKIEVDEMQLSESGLFRAQYPPDSSLRSLRHLRVCFFPPEEEVKELEPEPEKLDVVSRLKVEMGGSGSFFKRMRVPDLG